MDSYELYQQKVKELEKHVEALGAIVETLSKMVEPVVFYSVDINKLKELGFKAIAVKNIC